MNHAVLSATEASRGMNRNSWWSIVGGLAIAMSVFAVGTSGGLSGEMIFSAPEQLAAFAAVGIVSGLLLHFLTPLEQRVNWKAPRNNGLVALASAFVIVWLALHGDLRSWAYASGLASPLLLGAAPSLFASFAVALGAGCVYGLRPMFAGAFGAVFTVLAEIIQPWLPNYTFDPWDLAAGLIGAGLVVPVLMRWPVALHLQSSRNPNSTRDQIV